jgi:hypothetical protein
MTKIFKTVSTIFNIFAVSAYFLTKKKKLLMDIQNFGLILIDNCFVMDNKCKSKCAVDVINDTIR